uniref:Uncharacterized protein n=1 Tax=Anguilla anguilla TaxID=7936 RepID=A0A0E9RKN2_ANGAN
MQIILTLPKFQQAPGTLSGAFKDKIKINETAQHNHGAFNPPDASRCSVASL